MSDVAPAAPPRAVCMVADAELRQTLRRALAASGMASEFCEDIDAVSLGADTVLFVDRDHRVGISEAQLSSLIERGGQIVLLGDTLADLQLVELLREPLYDHVITEQPDESELGVTAAKLLSGDIFGLEKYLSWGARIHQREVANYEEKRAAIDEVAAAARASGARRPLIARIETTCDELLMNALYDAPVAKASGPATGGDAQGAPSSVAEAHKAQLRYASDGRYFALSVLDHYGTLSKRRLFDSILRARLEGGKPNTEGGAGLGLYFVLSAATRFVVNIEADLRTEVLCLFDLRERGRDAGRWARSLHVFTAP